MRDERRGSAIGKADGRGGVGGGIEGERGMGQCVELLSLLMSLISVFSTKQIIEQ